MDETSKRWSAHKRVLASARVERPRRRIEGEVVGRGTKRAERRRPGARGHREPALKVHLLAGLPTEAVRQSFERVSDVMPVVPLDGLAGGDIGDAPRIGVLLPPFVEPASVVESWTACEFLPNRFGRPAHVAGVSTFVDLAQVVDHLASAAPISLHGWGRSGFDGRTVADILVGQIESATHLVLVGADPASNSLARRLRVLNPTASRTPLRNGLPLDFEGFAVAPVADDGHLQGGSAESTEGRCRDDSGTDEPTAQLARVVPPWLEVLHGEQEPAPTSGLVVYRRARPFDPIRLQNWLEDPPSELVRGKGHVWLASEPDQSFGYSCAGAVHRLFPAGRWWASGSDGAWPSCSDQRRRLLERWHPRFGDRRQELVFAGVDLDAARLCAGLDACLLAEEAVEDGLQASSKDGPGTLRERRARLH